VDGLETLLDQGEKLGDDQRWIAYVLATAHHETDHTMQPIREYGLGKGLDYGTPDPETGQTYYGRGYVQLTWKSNYKLMAERLNVDLVGDPDLALQPAVAAEIIYVGMTEGLFSGKKLAEFFNNDVSDWYNARRIVNGLDRAQKVAGYATAFYTAILKASASEPLATAHLLALKSRGPGPEPNYIELEQRSLLAQ
jgi:hypothetical protein